MSTVLEKATVLGVRQLVEHLPSDNHTHDDSFARASGHLAGIAG